MTEKTFRCESGRMRITDPCYSRDTWCTAVREVLAGDYRIYKELSDEGDWGMRVKTLTVIHKDYAGKFLTWDEDTDARIGVDSGQCGFYDDAKFPEESGEYGDDSSLYGQVCDQTLSDKKLYQGSYGTFSSSGYGDGQYPLFVAKDNEKAVIVGLRLQYIGDEDEDEIQEEYDEE